MNYSLIIRQGNLNGNILFDRPATTPYMAFSVGQYVSTTSGGQEYLVKEVHHTFGNVAGTSTQVHFVTLVV